MKNCKDLTFVGTDPENSKKMIGWYIRRRRHDCKTESFYTTGNHKKSDCVIAGGFCVHWNAVFEAICCCQHQCPCHEAQPALVDEDIQPRTKKLVMLEMRKQPIKKKVDTFG